MQPENTPASFDWFENINHNYPDRLNKNYGLIPSSAAGCYEIPPWPAAAAACIIQEDKMSFCQSGLAFCAEKVSSGSTPESRALEASKNHREAERRRRQRINSHLDSLRALLPCNSRTDKASLLAKVVSRLRELKEEASQLMQTETGLLPSENDEITLSRDNGEEFATGHGGRLIIKASFCCEDRLDLFPDLIHTLKSLRLSPLRAEMATLGGRISNVLILSGDCSEHTSAEESILFLRNALKSVVNRSAYGSGSEGCKRPRTMLHDNDNYSNPQNN
ncbi:unnamed protein product [Cuscuta epithymum]|uniref:BHLH domain-containing protein n=1 Tax=Cuscuta epithymum TaxID=186058 RepID=A0AAV0CNZ8_9ASTE|nr:unnamed protein product [Cuscuta epithymum]